MRLVGERVTLIPVPRAVSAGVVEGAGLQAALDALGLVAAAGWPHAGSADALRPLVTAGPDPAHGTFLITVGPELVGECGWFGSPDDNGDAEIGYGVAASARGRGLGTEAVGVLAAWVEQQPGVERVTADALIGNEHSRRVLERLGFTPDRLPIDGAPPFVTYVRDRPHMDRSGDSG